MIDDLAQGELPLLPERRPGAGRAPEAPSQDDASLIAKGKLAQDDSVMVTAKEEPKTSGSASQATAADIATVDSSSETDFNGRTFASGPSDQAASSATSKESLLGSNADVSNMPKDPEQGSSKVVQTAPLASTGSSVAASASGSRASTKRVPEDSQTGQEEADPSQTKPIVPANTIAKTDSTTPAAERTTSSKYTPADVVPSPVDSDVYYLDSTQSNPPLQRGTIFLILQPSDTCLQICYCRRVGLLRIHLIASNLIGHQAVY